MRITLFGLLLVTIIACNDNKTLPEDVLSKDKMRSVMWDMLRADEWVSYEHTQDSATDRYKRSVELYQKVLQTNGVTASQFKKSFQYYQTRPALLKPLFDSLQRTVPRPGAYPL